MVDDGLAEALERTTQLERPSTRNSPHVDSGHSARWNLRVALDVYSNFEPDAQSTGDDHEKAGAMRRDRSSEWTSMI